MKIFRATAAVAFFAALCVGSSNAQQPRAGTTNQSRTGTTTPTAPATVPTVNVPDSKIALIDSSEFGDPQTGIVRVVNAEKKIEAEFAGTKKQLDDLDAQIKKAEADLAKV